VSPIQVAARSKAWVYGRSPSGIAASNPVGAWKSVYCEYFLLSGRGLCDGPISRPEESNRVWCVSVYDLETSKMRLPRPELGCCAKENTCKYSSVGTLALIHIGTVFQVALQYTRKHRKLVKWRQVNKTVTCGCHTFISHSRQTCSATCHSIVRDCLFQRNKIKHISL
jgi:hypothetical protein